MDWQGPPMQPRYQPTTGLHRTRQQKRWYDVFFGAWWDRSHLQPTSLPHNPAAAINRSNPQPTSLPYNPVAAINRSHPQPTPLPHNPAAAIDRTNMKTNKRSQQPAQ